jgi:L-seryl-tRNA(Ser) seleniumtransferase
MHALLASPALAPWVEAYGRARVHRVATRVLQEWRQRLAAGDPQAASPTPEAVVAVIGSALRREATASLRRVINATGVVLHTGLGRAPLAPEAIMAIAATAAGYCNLELDLERGERGHRSDLVAGLLRDLTGAEASLVVNNNAAAVLLVLTALAAGREVVVSRGELVEIGGGFRVPEVMAQGGARLREVGTTNRTHLRDYQEALGPDTALILRVHQSNFRLVGFQAAPPLGELVDLARGRGLPLVYDLGSGHLGARGAGRAAALGEPGVQEALAAGVDLVTFSGDKLLGGPQAGLLLGRADLVARCARHPLQRALRVDKLTLAALHATLGLYARGVAAARVPVLRMLEATYAELAARAERLAAAVRRALEGHAEVTVQQEDSAAGGGSLPGQALPTAVVAVVPRLLPAAAAQERLRCGEPPVLARVREDRLLLDPRTLATEDETELPALLREACVPSVTDGPA